MRGSSEREGEVKEWLRSQGAKDLKTYSFKRHEYLYFVCTDGIVDCISDTYEELFDIVELPEVKEEKYSFKPFDRVLVRNGNATFWRCNIFSHYIDDGEYPYFCIDSDYRQCIPYEGNEDKVGKVTD